MLRHDPAEWARLLRALAEPALRRTPLATVPRAPAEAAAFAAGFRDSAGDTNEFHAPVLARLLGTDPGVPPSSLSPAGALWWDVASRRAPSGPDPASVGPLFPHLRDWGIESWHENELAGAHALWHASTADPAWRLRLDRLVPWLLEEVQPDNATQRPWGVQVFVAAATRGVSGAAAYADVLVHGARVGREHPDAFAAVLLLDAALELEHLPAIR